MRSLGLLCLELVAATPTFGQRGADPIAWTIKSREADNEHGISK